MKKLNLLAIGAAALLMASCSQDDLVSPAQTGEGNYNVTIKLPGEFSTRAMSDGKTANNLYYAVYDASNDALVFNSQQSFNGQLETVVSMNLARGKSYKVAFFAQSPTSYTQGVYNFNPVDAVFTVDYTKMTNSANNADDYDCFYNLYTTNTIGEEAQNVSVTLTRPVAQINWGANDFNTGNEISALTSAFGAKGAYLTSTLTTQAYNTFSLLDNDVDETQGKVDVTLANFTAPNAVFPVDIVDGVSPYDYVGMQFLLAPKSTSVYDLNLTIDNSNNPTSGAEIVSYNVNVASAPVQANYRTNIYGSLLTDNIEFTVDKDPNWETDINIPYGNEVEGVDGLYLEGNTYTITSVEGLIGYANIANSKGGQNMSKYTVLLATDLDMSTVSNYVPFTNAGATFDGQGHTVYNLSVNTTGDASAGFMSSAIGTVSNLNFVDATVVGHFKAGVLAGDGLCAHINNVTVTGCSVTSTPWNKGTEYDDGNNVGGIVGYLSAEGTASLTNCSVSNSTIRAYRILGGLVGRLNGVSTGLQVENNSVSDVVVICDLTQNYKDLTPETVPVGEIYGQNLTTYDLPSSNVTSDVSIVYISEDGNIGVDSFAGLQAIANLGSSFTYGKTVTVPENTVMDLGGASVESIGFNALSSDFNNCTIDFQNSTISNFTVVGVGTGNHTGLFANFHGTLKNLNVENMTITNNAEGNCGVVGYLVGTMDNVNVKNIKISTPEKNVGALVGLCSATSNITGCSVDGAVLTGTARIGGLIGCINDTPNVTFTNCSVNNVEITCSTVNTAGTLIGQVYGGNWTQTGCTVTNTTINGTAVTEPGAQQY